MAICALIKVKGMKLNMEIIIISAVWCPSCLVMKKIYKDLEQRYKNIKFLKYDYDFDSDIVQNYQVSNILPIFIIEKDGIEIERIVGEHKIEDFILKIERYLDEK